VADNGGGRDRALRRRTGSERLDAPRAPAQLERGVVAGKGGHDAASAYSTTEVM
jgi:hypothetical protein